MVGDNMTKISQEEEEEACYSRVRCGGNCGGGDENSTNFFLWW
jgi:hypothetical protein